MKIKELKVNGFGKLNNKEISLAPGINVIRGKNESGKSTFLKFIPAILFGVSKNKNGNTISDFEKYEPWNTEKYSGKIEYRLDNSQTFEVYRDFRKKNPIIYNELNEDISDKFTVDKSKGISFFTDQTKIDEESFLNTAIVKQDAVKIDRNAQNSIVQKISNIVSSGNDNLSYKSIISNINKKQNENVGTERTSQRPLNIVLSKIDSLEKKKKELEQYRENQKKNYFELDENRCELEAENSKLNLLKLIRKRLDETKIKNAEISFRKNLEDNYNKKLQELNNVITRESEKTGTKFIIKYIVLFFVIAIMIATAIVLKPDSYIYLIFVLLFALVLAKMLFDLKNNDKVDLKKIENEIEIVKENLKNQQDEIEQREKELNVEVEEDNKDIIEEYKDNIDPKYIENCFKKSENEIQKEYDQIEKKINLLNIKINSNELEIRVINEKLEGLSSVEEELEGAYSEKEYLTSLNNSYNIAKRCMENAYMDVKQNISPNFINELCKIASSISNGKYTNIKLNDNDGIEVQVENGFYVPVSELSIGTIDQMYLSLRLSALRELSSEKIPIILDESFAFFDDDRLDNIIEYLSREFHDNQIIMFSCTNREIESLNRLNIEYNLINLEK